jgi:flagellar protein FlgJ
MFRNMRATLPGDPMSTDSTAEQYWDLFDQQASRKMAEAGGIGLADMLVRQLDPTAHAPSPAAVGQRKFAPPAGSSGPVEAQPKQPAPGAGPAPAGEVSVAPPPRPAARERFAAAEDFVAAMWPHAQQAAQSLGVNPKVLIAQAALETGWGRHIGRRAGGKSSYNLFGIKADRRWRGEQVAVSTLEYRHGVFQKEQAPFRAYASFAESFHDYVSFIQNQPRYREALANAGDPAAYLRSLQAAGYATDPRYADKILKILQSEALQGVTQAGSPPLVQANAGLAEVG